MKKVLVGGCFDLIHYGHIVFLKEARKQGDYLIVALESDDNVKKYKGENRPVHKQSERAEMLRSLRMVDEVIELPPMNSDKEYFDLVKHVLLNVIAITKDDPQTANKKKQAKEIGSKVVVVIHRLEPHSTTRLIEKFEL
ncbi:MAG: Glycerol-3-phosphate cytidyltransferase TagD [Candidatus Roizmanbacteria bacterium GW2011_GWC2_41_7]|uniref:Glycerol-3-phosphate cytidyltransferase TagD n=1 Tax=Candidatus Roizmanbacteria bacterium GW2011_GWC2_41_7 TaxID=1618487 RepID=A0A0G0X8X8_9BACT|nr:MAG: Glycerol-3-phosphate cytidyltransferase TagD [Candidatus Roizmanbacteria bacterium GW2011_GWC2_41_7]